ncbi:hypothetical protein EEZ25_26095 [Micromonospora aurantiaca]|nr:hypothetical protein EEZ25_26095 [Micromonospora aurantiaca]
MLSGLSPLVIEDVADEGERIVVGARRPQGTAVCSRCRADSVSHSAVTEGTGWGSAKAGAGHRLRRHNHPVFNFGISGYQPHWVQARSAIAAAHGRRLGSRDRARMISACLRQVSRPSHRARPLTRAR